MGWLGGLGLCGGDVILSVSFKLCMQKMCESVWPTAQYTLLLLFSILFVSCSKRGSNPWCPRDVRRVVVVYFV